MEDKIEELLDIINSLAYVLSYYKYPNHYDYEAVKNEILLEAGLDNEYIKEITNEEHWRKLWERL